MQLKKLNSKAKGAIILGIVVFFVGGFFLFNAYALQMIDSFTDTSKIADSWNINISTSTGEVKLSQKTCDNGEWFCYETSVCDNDLGDGTKILVKRTTESGGKKWKTTQTACDTPQCGSDGAQSGDNLVADNTVDFSYYPARDACKTVGGRLPTMAELQCMYDNKVTFGNNFATYQYWSSEEFDTTRAKDLWFSDGNQYNNNKDSASLSVRCVRGW